MARPTHPSLAPGSKEEWAQINEGEEREEAAFARSLSIAERIEVGQQLCDQAFGLLNAVRPAGDGFQRDPRA